MNDFEAYYDVCPHGIKVLVAEPLIVAAQNGGEIFIVVHDDCRIKVPRGI